MDPLQILIDFDEAGRIGDAHYGPLPFNSVIPRAPNVKPGEAISTYGKRKVKIDSSFENPLGLRLDSFIRITYLSYKLYHNSSFFNLNDIDIGVAKHFS